MTEADRRELWSHMRAPTCTFVALLAMLGIIVLLGAFLPFRNAWMIEAAVTLGMVVTVLMFSMEIPQEPPILRFYACLGFFWVAILFSIITIDYLTR